MDWRQKQWSCTRCDEASSLANLWQLRTNRSLQDQLFTNWLDAPD
jgi:hypothetical protein